ncbi:thermonuclease family protein [Piscibacillus sp. B03]|uniref:thermonuclease family protein n=1 Tax=Piscibacillus sp. B03 TaxID=3457430 RepID=UPI003FCDF79A
MVLEYPEHVSNELTDENNEQATDNIKDDISTDKIEGELIRHVDGDTSIVFIPNLDEYGYSKDVITDNGEYRVRYILINTPEICHESDCEPEPYGKEALDFMNSIIQPGDTIYLEQDTSETDPYGRLLFYVYLEDGRMVQELLLSEGLAKVAIFEPDTSYAESFQSIEEEAREKELGIWANK